MNKRAKLLLASLLLLLLPLRALAAVTIGFCASQEGMTHAAQDGAHGHSQQHEPQPASGGGTSPDCNSCVEHCANMVIAVPAPKGAILATGSSAFPALERAAASFVPDCLDPPPVRL